MHYDNRYNEWEYPFKIKGVAYVIRCTAGDHMIYLLIDVENTDLKLQYQFDTRSDFDRAWGDMPPRFVSDAQVDADIAVLVFKRCYRFIHHMLQKDAPYYFTFSANDDRKLAVYRKVAKRLARQYGYFVDENHGKFQFYKVAQQAKCA